MSCKKNNKASVQKVVIPKGMINPGETTIIEIPSSLQKQPIVVAKRKTSADELPEAEQKKCCSKKSKNKESSAETTKPSTYADANKSGKQSRGAAAADLEAMERKEREQFLKDLEDFQKARRRLISNASFLAGEKAAANKNNK